MRLLFLSIGILGAVELSAYAQNPPPAVPPATLERITNDLHVIRGEGGNTLVYLTDEGVVLVDPKFDRNHDDIVAKVKSLTDKPVRYIVNSHGHPDHTGGNAPFAPAVVVGHRNIRRLMVESKLSGVPTLAFTDTLSLHVGGKEVVAMHFAPCHTDGDTFVYFPAARTLAMGDCFNTADGQGRNLTGSPTFSFYMDYDNGASVIGKMKAGDAALRLEFDTVVPGHGPLTDRAGLSRWRADIDRISARLRTMIGEKKTRAEMADMLVADFGWDRNGRTIERSLDGIIAELSAR
jgi:glyoxylase-like metal-dependent hydrolase (beta-lactamase superfamily II)